MPAPRPVPDAFAPPASGPVADVLPPPAGRRRPDTRSRNDTLPAPDSVPQPGRRRDRGSRPPETPPGGTAPTGPLPVVAWHEDAPAGPGAPSRPVAPAGDDDPVPGYGRGGQPTGDGYAPDADDREPARGGQRVRRTRTPVGPRPRLPRVAALDGFRAVALLAVLAFHQGFHLARGGFLALSSFLTLSGFLLATVALTEWSRDGGLAVRRLLAHRCRRIVPPVVITVGLVVVLQVTLRVGAGPAYRGDVLAALGQVLNWRYVLDGGFARVLTDPSPVQHLWALSVLVQGTVAVVLLFVGLTKVTRAHRPLAGGAFALLAVASFAAAWATAGRSGNDGAAFFGTHTRVGELLVGVVLAYAMLSPRVRDAVASPAGARALRLGTPAVVVALLYLWTSTGLYSTNLFGGITAANALLTAGLILALTVPGPVTTALGTRPLRLLGGVTYAAFLVHWPLFLLLDEDRLGFDGPPLFVVRLAATLAAGAALTYGFERPLRRARLPAPRAALALGLALVVVGAAAIVLPRQPPPGVSLTIDDGSGPGDLDVVAPAGDEAASIALVGGSLAGSLVPGIEAWNADHPDRQVRVATHVAPDCPLSGPGPVRLAGDVVGEGTACLGFGPRLPRLLDAAEPDVVVVVPDAADVGGREIDGQWVHPGDPVFDTWFRHRLEEVTGDLAGTGARVVWATSPHVRLKPGDGGDWTSVADNDPARMDRLNEIVRLVAGRDGMSVLDLGARAQRLPRGEFAPEQRADGRDLTEDGATRMAAWMVPALLDLLGAGGEPAEDGSTAAPGTATTPAPTGAPAP